MFEKQIRGKTIRRLMSTTCAISFCMYGYDAGVLGGVQETRPFHQAMGYPTGTYVIPMIASAYTLAAAVWSLALTVIGLPLGRRMCILLGNGCVIVGGILQASAWSVPQMIVGRIICGIGIGFISCSVPTYQAEMSTEIEQRGPDVAVTCVFLVAGAAIAYWIDFGFNRLDSQISWRIPIAFQCVFAVFSGSIILVLPDTPRWYYARGLEKQGDETLSRLFDAPVDDPRVQHMKQSILASIELESKDTHKFDLMSLVWDRSELRAGRRIRISFLILAIQQMMGINLSVYYSTVIFSQIGLSQFMSQLLAALMNTMFALGTVPLVFTIEKVGRRNVLMYSAVVLTICMAIFVAMIGLPNPTTATQWVAVGAIFVYNTVFGYGWIGVCWLYGPEIAPLKLRHAGAAAGAFGEWLFSFITVFAGGIALQNVGWKIWLWMALSCFVAIPFVYFMCPETTGKTLEEIDLIFATESVRERIVAEQLADQQIISEKANGSTDLVESV
ncbi:general substrate transporter [Phialemonium atrogriseum]|uniref:General substrate transporter n=1 Tax=Phialemonium atrogriseum TaxID=1093897 RepID=A0AAJ0BT25_9PEZI|nr:general substrate transporter [Phialemonium atrogriseum]KAK1763974.1 general substrate transporter [Phialemonium atrogriseum]